MGRRQVVRQRILIPSFGGSNPPAPANQFNDLAGPCENKACSLREFCGSLREATRAEPPIPVAFRSSRSPIRRHNAPANFAIIKHIASNLMRQKAGKHSMRVKRRLAAWDDDYLSSLIFGAG